VSTDKRIRGRRLQAIRAAHFAREPLCIHCFKQGRTRLATELDHIKALCNGGKDVPENRQGLCQPCHDAKTMQDLGISHKQAFDAMGEPMPAGPAPGGYLGTFRRR
jgi:5-methylcytosine-specific restriction endonuclease McrA